MRPLLPRFTPLHQVNDMKDAPIRVLVVDDFEKVRQFLCSKIAKRPSFMVVGQAGNGVEAIAQAKQLQPDIVLLDVGLPKLDGIKAARQIASCSPGSHIIYISANRELEIVEACLQAGGRGYVLKSDLENDFWPAVEAALRGDTFLSSSVSAADRPARQEKSSGHHMVVCLNHAALVAQYAAWVAPALKRGSPVIVVADEAHQRGVQNVLREHGLDVEAAIRGREYRYLNPSKALAEVMKAGMPDPSRLSALVQDLIQGKVQPEGPQVRVVAGEMSPQLLAEGKVEAAIELEKLWEELTAQYALHTLCGYLTEHFDDKQPELLQEFTAHHSAVIAC